MPHGVTRNNWHAMAALAVERLHEAASAAVPQSFEEQTLIAEAARIEEMMRAVNVTDSSARPELRSHLLAVHVHDPLQVSDDLVEFAGAIANVYCRWYRQLRPASKTTSSS